AMTQRLVRRLCLECAKPVGDHSALLHRLGLVLDPPYPELYGPAGCEKCHGTGYRGRIGLFELMEVTPAMRRAIRQDDPPEKVEELARREGMKTLAEDGLRKLIAGVTSVDEVLRVLGL